MEQREEFVREALKHRKPFRHLCDDYGISPKTGYKWMDRFYEYEWNGFQENNRKPNKSPDRLSEDLVCDIINIKGNHLTWGTKKILELYKKRYPGDSPSLSSINRIFKRAGLIKPKRRQYQ